LPEYLVNILVRFKIPYYFYFQGEFETLYPGTVSPWEGQAKNAPFDKDFFFVLNNACGGTA
jgi:hypothetical protein